MKVTNNGTGKVAVQTRVGLTTVRPNETVFINDADVLKPTEAQRDRYKELGVVFSKGNKADPADEAKDANTKKTDGEGASGGAAAGENKSADGANK